MTNTSQRQRSVSDTCLRVAGLTLAMAILLQRMVSAAQTPPAYKVLYAFTGGADGGQPMAALIRDSAGNLYGTTQGGGILSGPCAPAGCGVVFKLDPSGKETVLYRFTGGEDGASPAASLVRDSAGNLYSSAGSGGRSCIWSGNGCGVIFKLDPATGQETVLHAFSGGADGWSPGGNLLLDGAGNLYGTTALGGNQGGCGGAGCGVVFKLDPTTGEETVLYTFTGGPDGGQPVAGLLRDSAGNFYGTASLGGIPEPCGIGCGVAFRLESTDIESVLYTFRDGADGGVPVASLIKDSVGNFYGTTEYGGTSDWGVVFKLSPSGVETVLHAFTGGADGATPRAGLIQDAASNRYGTALQGGTGTFFTNGVVFKLNSAGAFSVLHTFAANGTEGANPEAGLLIDPAGNLYGTASTGGAGFGVVFELMAAASVPIVKLSPISLTFPTEAIGTTSSAKTVAVKNTGTASLTITSIAIVGTNAADFAQTHTCGSSLPAGASCSVSITFKPTASGTRTAALSISDNASGTPQKVSLSGVGTTAKLSPTSVNFGTVALGSTSSSKTVTLTNIGTTTLTVSSVAITGTEAGDFTQIHNCGSSLAAAASCVISITFKPTASGTRTAALSIADNAAGSPQKVSLSGIGTTAKLLPTSLNFGSVGIGATSLPKTVTLTNVGTNTLTIRGIGISGPDSGDFFQTHTCGSSLARGAACSIRVNFKPVVLGTRAAVLSVSDNAPGSPQKVALSGIGISATLTGYCAHSGVTPLSPCGVTSDTTQCPPGEPAINPVTVSCGVGGIFSVDEARGCSVVINGLRFRGACQYH